MSFGTPLQLDSPAEWPEIPLGRSPASASAARSPSAWTQPSPRLRAVDGAAAGSALVRYEQPASTDELDDEMRLALELSLAEYESTQK